MGEILLDAVGVAGEHLRDGGGEKNGGGRVGPVAVKRELVDKEDEDGRGTNITSQQRLVSVPSKEMRPRIRAICCAAMAHSSRYFLISSAEGLNGMLLVPCCASSPTVRSCR